VDPSWLVQQLLDVTLHATPGLLHAWLVSLQPRFAVSLKVCVWLHVSQLVLQQLLPQLHKVKKRRGVTVDDCGVESKEICLAVHILDCEKEKKEDLERE
jgi:hypothetical protein